MVPALKLVLIAALGTGAAAAVLGQPAVSAAGDAARLRAQIRLEPGQGFGVLVLQAPDGSLIREFESPSGLIFAVAWQGPVMPDLAALLGADFSACQRAAQLYKQRHRARGPLHLATDKLLIDNAGHARSFQGRVIRLDLLPANVSPAVVR